MVRSSADSVFTGVVLGTFEVGSALFILGDLAFVDYSVTELVEDFFSTPRRRSVVIHDNRHFVIFVGIVFSERIVFIDERVLELAEGIVDVDSSHLRFGGSDKRV